MSQQKRSQGRAGQDTTQASALLGQEHALGGEEEGGITRQQGDAMTTVPMEEQ